MSIERCRYCGARVGTAHATNCEVSLSASIRRIKELTECLIEVTLINTRLEAEIKALREAGQKLEDSETIVQDSEGGYYVTVEYDAWKKFMALLEAKK